MVSGSRARLGIMGGTFDPIHFGHLVTAEVARDRFQLNKVIFVPSGHPPHKESSRITEAKHRYLMTVLAVASNPYFEVSGLEIERSGPSYAIDTVQEFRQTYPSDLIYFITGADAILELLTWKNVEQLLKICYFIAATRPGYNLDYLDSILQKLPPKAAQRIFFLEVPALAISSTDIRRRLEEGCTIKYLLPENVEHYIIKKKLYLDP